QSQGRETPSGNAGRHGEIAMTRRLISGGSAYEKKWGYSRAVADGDFVFVSGTTGFDYATMTISPDPAEQPRPCCRPIAKGCGGAGSSFADIVSARYYLPDAKDWEVCGAVLGEIL